MPGCRTRVQRPPQRGGADAADHAGDEGPALPFGKQANRQFELFSRERRRPSDMLSASLRRRQASSGYGRTPPCEFLTNFV